MALRTPVDGVAQGMPVIVPVALARDYRLPVARPVDENDIELPPLTMLMAFSLAGGIRKQMLLPLELLNVLEVSEEPTLVTHKG